VVQLCAACAVHVAIGVEVGSSLCIADSRTFEIVASATQLPSCQPDPAAQIEGIGSTFWTGVSTPATQPPADAAMSNAKAI
jgi:hypothetical protein